MKAGHHEKYVDLSQAIKFNGGGHFNHEFFWDNLSPVSQDGGVLPIKGSELMNWIEKDFGSIENLMQHFS